jgi:pimeloyl-ACP methyl ester carboxylesterase
MKETERANDSSSAHVESKRESRYNGESSGTINIGGAIVYYEKCGLGRPLVFVHGACENSLFWNHQKILSDRFEILTLDLPGHGRSPPIDRQVTLDTYADIVSQFIEANCSEKAILVGHSMGGGVALLNAIHNPHLLRGLVLVGTGAKLGVLPSIREGLKSRFEETVRSIVGPRQFAAATSLETIRFVTNEITKCRAEIAFADYDACNSFDVRSNLRTISLPTLIIVGEEDRMTPVIWSAYMKENIPNSKLVVLKQASHLPMLERPSDFNRHLNEFAISVS